MQCWYSEGKLQSFKRCQNEGTRFCSWLLPEPARGSSKRGVCDQRVCDEHATRGADGLYYCWMHKYDAPTFSVAKLFSDAAHRE